MLILKKICDEKLFFSYQDQDTDVEYLTGVEVSSPKTINIK
jgi:hypothetical protein